MADEKQEIVWYGPHACSVCGVTIVKAAAESGGEELEPPKRLMRAFHRGSESGDPDLVYPATWKPHVHNPDSSALNPTPSASPATV